VSRSKARYGSDAEKVRAEAWTPPSAETIAEGAVDSSSTKSRVPAIQRMAAVLRVVGGSPRPLRLAEITAAVGAPKSSVMGICQALTLERALSRGSDGRYWLGPRVAELAAAAAAMTPTLRRVALTVPGMTNVFYAAEKRAAAYEAGSRGIELIVDDAGYDTEVQAQQIARYIEADVDLIIVDPVTSHGLEEQTAAASAAGIPVVAINANAIGADLAITTDNTLAGSLAARELIRRFPEAATVAIVDGSPVTAIADRVHGFREALRDAPWLTVVAHGRGSNNRSNGERVAAEILAQHPDVDAIFAVNDPTSLGVADACRRLSARALIVSVDGSPEVVDRIESGSMHLATSSQDPAALVEAAFRYGAALCGGFHPSQGTILLPSSAVTAANASEYTRW
jgi:ribose transport system substrate-binding protein